MRPDPSETDFEPPCGDGIGGHERPYRGGTNDWLTPQYILAALGPFDLDPCAMTGQPWATASRHFTVVEDGLRQQWSGRVWLNPPYGEQTGLWLEKMAAHQDGIVLVFARTENRMFFDFVWPKANAVFLKGRIAFCAPDGESAGEAGAPSALLSYDRAGSRRNYELLRTSGLEGQFLRIR